MSTRMCRYCASELVVGRMFVCGECERSLLAKIAKHGDIRDAAEEFMRERKAAAGANQKALFGESEEKP